MAGRDAAPAVSASQAGIPGRFGSPSAPTTWGCLQWLDWDRRAQTKVRALGSAKSRPPRPRKHGPEAQSRRREASRGVRPCVKRARARALTSGAKLASTCLRDGVEDGSAPLGASLPLYRGRKNETAFPMPQIPGNDPARLLPIPPQRGKDEENRAAAYAAWVDCWIACARSSMPLRVSSSSLWVSSARVFSAS